MTVNTVPRILIATASIACLFIPRTQASAFRDSLFISGIDSLHCTLKNGLTLKIQYHDTMRLENGPVRPFGSENPKSPDVVVMRTNHFRFFWSDSQKVSGGPKLYRTDAMISDTGITIGNAVCVSGAQNLLQNPLYFHADVSDTNFFLSDIEKDITGKSLMIGYSNRATSRIQNIGDGNVSLLDASQCHFINNVFLAVYEKSSSVIFYNKIFLNYINPSLSVQQEDTVAINQFPCFNPSVAADSAGNTLFLWARGTRATVKTLSFAFCDSTFTFNGQATALSDPIDDFDTLNKYDEAPVLSYGRGKFASVNWDQGGIMLRLYEIKTASPHDTMSVLPIRVTSQSNSRYPALAANSSYLTVAWTEHPAQNTVFLKCVRYVIQNGIFISAPKDTIVNTVANNTFVSGDIVALNSAMDSAGNVGLCWQMNKFAQMAVLSSRNMYYDSGSWTSPPLPIQAGIEDSVCFDSGAAIASQFSQVNSFQGFLGMSVDSSDAHVFFPLSSGTSLKNNTKGLYKYFQYAISLHPSPNLLQTPIIQKIFLRWNAKPRFNSLDTVTVGSTLKNGAKFGDTVLCRSRIDSISCRFSLFDADSADTLYSNVTWLSFAQKDTLSKFSARSSKTRMAPLMQSDTVIACMFSARDARNWSAQDNVVFIKTINVVPTLRVRAVHNGNPRDTLAIAALSTINVQQSDSVEFLFSIADSNDPGVKVFLSLNGTTVDSAGQGTVRRYLFRCSQGRPQGDDFRFGAADTDTAVAIRVICAVNHFPHLDSVSINGHMLGNNDTIQVIPGSPTPLVAHAFDEDVGYWDSLVYIFVRGHRDTLVRDSAIMYTADRFDTAVKIVVYDLFGIRDSMRFLIKFPWYANDSIGNPDLYAEKKTLLTVSQIVGGSEIDTIPLSIKNTGNDTLMVRSLRFSGKDRRWLNVLVPRNGALQIFSPSDSGMLFPQYSLPDSTLRFFAVFSSDSLAGDGLLYDTIIIGLNDGVRKADTLPVRLEHNDLPRITDCSIQFINNKPYWLAKQNKKTGTATQKYTFPPFAKLSVSFSEPMDSISALSAITAFSVWDLTLHDSTPIPLVYTWAESKTRVDVSPRYAAASTFFGIRPLPGFFIPTDSIRLAISSSITDLARTPSGPNRLDVHRIAKRNTAGDTSFSFRVDSVKFTVASVFPDQASQGAAPATPIIVTFSSAPLPGTMDTRLAGNSMLIVRSSRHASPINFSRIYAAGDSIVFSPAKRFFYGDTVRCRYRGMWARDSLGYSVDLNKNGIPASMFDSTSNQDDKEWFFIIKNINHASVFPTGGAIDIAINSPLRISLNDTVPQAAIDTAPSNNRTLSIGTRCSGGSRINFDSVRISGATISFYPVNALYYGDSVFCSYRGLSTIDTGRFAFDADRGPIFSNDTIEWSFIIKPIKLMSVSPESASISPSIHPEIVLRFSAPIFSGTFDTDTSNKNRSFAITSAYSNGMKLPFKSITYSADRSQISLRPNSTFYSNDSINCVFSGFVKDYSYGATDNLPGNGPLVCSKKWTFFVRTNEFYTYPNPYKPGIDPRHCSAQGPCGIWFKNLDVLTSGAPEVSIKIFSINAHPLYSTQEAGIRIRFETRNQEMRPEWKWDTRNQRGELVASGLYLYAIYDTKGKALMKGKLMIVR